MTYYYFLSILLLIFLLFSIYFENLKNKINIFDIPEPRKIHKIKIACIGGFFVIFSVVFLILFYKNLIFDAKNLFLNRGNFLSFYVFSFFIFLVGILDDKVNLSPIRKTVLLNLILLFVITADKTLIIKNINFSFFNLNFILPDYFAILFTLISIFIFLNAFNMFDGINLQSGIYALVFFIFLTLKSGYLEIFLPIILSLIFFLILNIKNQTFLGNNGSYLLGYLISWFSIKLHNFQVIKYSDYIVLLMLIPILDLFRLTIYRLTNNNNPMSPDNNHLHHLLLRRFKFRNTILILSVLIIMPLILENYFPKLYLIIFVSLFYFFLISYLQKNTNQLISK